MATNVPQITFGATGVIIPTSQEILAGVIADMQAAFGGSLNLSIDNTETLSTPQGQLASSWAAVILNSYETFQYQSTQTDPSYAQGRWQDAIGRIYFLDRDPAEPTVIQVSCNGLTGVTIPESALVSDASGQLYACTQSGTIGADGYVTLPFSNTVPGPTAVPSSVSIYQAISGWDSATIVSGTIGNVTEGRQKFEDRRELTVSANSFGAAGSIIGAVAKVPDVLDFFGYDNSSSSPVVVRGKTIGANSIYIAVSGGDDSDIAQAILSKKGPGCGYTGNTTVVAYDNNSLYSSPIAYDVSFERPTALQILFSVDIVSSSTVPSTVTADVQAQIISAFSGSVDGVPRARIGSDIFASDYVCAIRALGSWAKIKSLNIGSNNTASVTFTGAISGTSLTTSAPTGTIAIGQTISSGGSGPVAAGTRIVSGSGSSWQVNVSQTVSSRAMTGAVANQDEVEVGAAQQPEVTADNIVVTLT